MKALITGFDPFGGELVNPAFEAIKNMAEQIELYDIVKLEIPTVFNKSLEVLDRTIEREKPDIVICVGQAGGRFTLSLEYVGINLDEARIPDNEGQIPSGNKIRENGKNAYFSTLPNKAILKMLKDNNVPAAISHTAGTYVCNHLLYGLLYLIENKYPNIRGGFVHVPFLPEQVLDKKNTPFMPLDMMTKGLELIVKSTIMHPEDIDYQIGETH
jgi:pyroglutamyl-peptidase